MDESNTVNRRSAAHQETGIITGRTLGLRICEALDIPAENISRVELVADPGDAARVNITRFVSDNEAGIIGACLKEYVLLEDEGKIDQLECDLQDDEGG